MVTKPKIIIPPHAPYAPARMWSEVVYAIKALQAGQATAEQQALAFDWLIVEVCKKDDMSFRPGGPEAARDTDFAEGKRFVAIQVLKAYNMPPDKVAEMRNDEIRAAGGIIEGDEIGRHE